MSRGRSLARTFERVRTEPGLLRNTLVVIGLIVVAGVVGGIILGSQRMVAPWADRVEVTAAFAASPGISPGNGQEVRIAGVTVGDITEANVGPDGQALLTLSMEPGHRLYENATLVLRPKSPLNEMYVTIHPGGPPAAEVHSGYQFPITATQRPIQVDEVLNHLDDDAQRMLTALLAESDVALTSAQRHLPAGLDATRTVANRLRPVSEQLAVRKELIRRLIHNIGLVAHAVGSDDERVRTLAASLQTTLRTFGARQSEFDQTLAELPGVAEQLRRSTDAVRQLTEELDPTLRDFERASEELPEALKDLRGTADQVDRVVDVAEPFLEQARGVVADLRPFTAELTEALPELHAATERFDPMTGGLLPYLPDLGAFTVQTRSIVSLEDANSGILRAILPISWQTLPPVLGTNNGVKPLPLPLPNPPAGR